MVYFLSCSVLSLHSYYFLQIDTHFFKCGRYLKKCVSTCSAISQVEPDFQHAYCAVCVMKRFDIPAGRHLHNNNTQGAIVSRGRDLGRCARAPELRTFLLYAMLPTTSTEIYLQMCVIRVIWMVVLNVKHLFHVCAIWSNTYLLKKTMF